jgi:acetylornithine deacetylase/succinyl-diaminopimelate desuccinylase-like protein
MKSVLEYLDRADGDARQTLADYVAVRSTASSPSGLEDAVQFTGRRLKRCGFDVLIERPFPDAPPYLLARAAGATTTTVLIYGHYDVREAGDERAWLTPPFVATEVGDRIYGRGVSDNKGQHLAHILALEASQACGGLPCNVVLLLDGEEEVGSPHLDAYVHSRKRELSADLALWSDGPVHESGRNCLVFGNRGIVRFEIRIRTGAKDLHSGNWGGVAPNALWALVELLASLRSEDGHLLVAGLDVPRRIEDAVEARALEKADEAIDLDVLLAQDGLATLDLPKARTVMERLSLFASLSINSISGGDAAQTVIPSEASATCDVRLVPGQSPTEVYRALREHISSRAPQAELTLQASVPPSYTAMTVPFVEPIKAAVEAQVGVEPLLLPPLGGTLPTHVFTNVLGIPTIGVPFANPDQANHAPNENLELERYRHGIRIAARILEQLRLTA